MEGNYSQGSCPPSHMMSYFPGYNMSQGPISPSASNSSSRTGASVSIWAGDLDAYMDETFLRQAVAASGWGSDITRIKVVRDHYSGMHAGYGFLDAASPEAAQRVIATGSGMPIPGTNRCWRLNMGRSSATTSANVSVGSESNVYVGNLESSVTDYQLMTVFRPRYSSVRHAKVVCNEYGQSRGFGFIRFGNPVDAERAVAEMQGYIFNQKPIRLSPAAGRVRNSAGNNGGHQGHGHHGQAHVNLSGRPMHSQYNHSHGAVIHTFPTHKRPRQLMSPDDPNNTTLFIGGTAAHITEELLWREFSTFGELDAVRVPVNKTGFVFVRFRLRECAERAKDEVSRTHFVSLNPSKPVRVEWASEQIPVARPPISTAHSSRDVSQSSFDGHYNSYSDPAAPDVVSSAFRTPMGPSQNGAPVTMLQNNGIETLNTLDSSSRADLKKETMATGDPTYNNSEIDSTRREMPNNSVGNLGGSSGDTEPPSKRVAVARPEYTGSVDGVGNSSTRSDPIVDRKGEGGEEESPAMQFSWLKSSNQGASNGQ